MGSAIPSRSRAIAFALLACALPARAGMPSLNLTDVARLRLETISFFLLAFLLSAAAVMGLWNTLRRDFPRLPRLTYKRSLALTTLWGLCFILVLTMISGARELMTPGAWEKRGATYQLTSHQSATDTLAHRTTQLAQLKAALFDYAAKHAGQFPPNDRDPAIPSTLWQSPDLSRARYLYQPTTRPAAPLAYEPDLFPGPRLVLQADGRITPMTNAELTNALAAEAAK